MSSFDQAEIYIKELLAPVIEIGVKEINKQLINDRVVPGLILMVTGGQAVNRYFPNSQSLRTHDFDLKVIPPKKTPVTPRIKRRLLLLGAGIARYLSILLNSYLKDSGINIIKNIKNRYGLKLETTNNNVFYPKTNNRRRLLNTVLFRLYDEEKIKTNSVADVYVIDPAEVDHYRKFAGLPGSNPILSENSGNYYIPHNDINGVPYAGMGYIIWDTLRMVELSKELGLKKLKRYADKRDAIFNALNNPNTGISCNAMKDYMLDCERKYKSCSINNRTFKSKEGLITYGVTEGVLPSDPDFIKKLMESYDINYLCGWLSKLI